MNFDYKRLLNQIESGIIKHKCTDKSSLDIQMAYWDDLYFKIKEEGYKAQKDLEVPKSNFLSNEDEIKVRIDRSILVVPECYTARYTP